MEANTQKQVHRENDAWLDEAKVWLAEAAQWKHDQAAALTDARAEVQALETLLAGTTAHVDSLDLHVAVLKRDPLGATHEKEREAHHSQKVRHSDMKKANHDALRHKAH